MASYNTLGIRLVLRQPRTSYFDGQAVRCVVWPGLLSATFAFCPAYLLHMQMMHDACFWVQLSTQVVAKAPCHRGSRYMAHGIGTDT
eukprot:6202623-Pleurochrysis_carterae.AAC.2